MPDTDLQIFAHPAAVIHRAALEPSVAESLLAIARSRAPDPTALDEFPPFFWAAQCTNTRLDTYYTHMGLSSLKNYATEADAGVAFQNSHTIHELSLGRSLTGRFTGAQGNGVAHVLADFFTVRGINLTGLSTDDFINGIRTGLVTDVSIGFYGGRHMCDICGFNLMDWENCRHYPGTEAEVPDKNDPKVKRLVTATATIEDAHLAEVSAVYHGSTPGAVILKAQQAADAGRIEPRQARLLEHLYRINLPSARHAFAGVGEGRMPTRETEAETGTANPPAADPPPATEPEAAPAPPAPTPDPQPPADDAAPEAESERRVVSYARSQFAEANIKAEEAPGSMREVVALALEGKRYRDNLIAYALKEGTRAHGDKFNRPLQEGILRRLSIEEIIDQTRLWGGKGDEIFPGGRLTADGTDLPDNPNGTTAPQRATHDGAYMT